MLGLSSAISVNISSYYPDCGLEKYKLLFNCKIEPDEVFKRTDEIHILFCFNGTVKTGDFFTPNHFDPLIVEEIGSKRKQKNVSSVTVKKPFPSESFVPALGSDVPYPRCVWCALHIPLIGIVQCASIHFFLFVDNSSYVYI